MPGGNETNPGVGADVVNSRRVIEWDDDDENDSSKPALCCLQGCLAGTAVGFSFFVALPTGILLVVLSTSKESEEKIFLGVGISLIILPLIVLLIVIFLCMNQDKLSRLKFWKKKTTPNIEPSSKTTPNSDINSNRLSYKNTHHLRSIELGIPQSQIEAEGQRDTGVTNNSNTPNSVKTDYNHSHHDKEIHI